MTTTMMIAPFRNSRLSMKTLVDSSHKSTYLQYIIITRCINVRRVSLFISGIGMVYNHTVNDDEPDITEFRIPVHTGIPLYSVASMSRDIVIQINSGANACARLMLKRYDPEYNNTWMRFDIDGRIMYHDWMLGYVDQTDYIKVHDPLSTIVTWITGTPFRKLHID